MEGGETIANKEYVKRKSIGSLVDICRREADLLRDAQEEFEDLKKRDLTGQAPQRLIEKNPNGSDFDDPRAWNTETAKENLESAKNEVLKKISILFPSLVTEESAGDLKTLRDEVRAYMNSGNDKAALRSLRSLASCLGVDLVQILENPDQQIEIIAQ